MRLEHAAVWTSDLDRLRAFYEVFFGARAGDRYESVNQVGFASYFLSFPEGNARLELMYMPELAVASHARAVGYAHLAFSIGSREAVDSLTNRMRDAGVRVRSEPRQTGDGYYESVVEDPDGNVLEITA